MQYVYILNVFTVLNQKYGRDPYEQANVKYYRLFYYLHLLALG